MALPLISCINSLQASYDVGDEQTKMYRRRALAHVGCILANICAVEKAQGRKGHLHMIMECLIKLVTLCISDEIQEHALRYDFYFYFF